MGEVKSDPEHPCPGCKHTEFVERLFRICTVCKTRVGAPEEKRMSEETEKPHFIRTDTEGTVNLTVAFVQPPKGQAGPMAWLDVHNERGLRLSLYNPNPNAHSVAMSLSQAKYLRDVLDKVLEVGTSNLTLDNLRSIEQPHEPSSG